MIKINLLKELYKINSKSGSEHQLTEFICQYVKDNYPKNVLIEEDQKGNIYITKGKASSYPTMAAHLDQVGSYKGELTIFRKDNIMIAVGEDGKLHNLGADDKNGIWVALQLLRSEPVFKCVFFVGEEVGCIGSHACDMSFFKDSRFVLQCDRRNGTDFINNASSTELCPSNWPSTEIKAKYGYKNTYGAMTDVMTLKNRGLSVACCNMSCGYYNPHTENEFTKIEELINCLRFCQEIIATYKEPIPHEKKAYSYSGGYYGHHRGSEDGMDYANQYYGWDYDGWDY